MDIQVIDVEAGTEIVRPMTTDELAQNQLDAARITADRLAKQTAATNLAALKASAITKLTTGIALTAQEAALLVL